MYNFYVLSHLFCCKISLLCDLRCFVAKSVLSLFTRFGVEKNWAKNFVCGEKRTNIRYGWHDTVHLNFLSYSCLFSTLSPPHVYSIFSTPKRVNCAETDFATKQQKSHIREILQQNSIKCDKTSNIVHIIQTLFILHLTESSPHLWYGEIFHFTTSHGENFSTWPIFSPQTPSVASVTNIRCELISIHI